MALVHFAGLTDKGPRKNNQDHFLAREVCSGIYLLAVADGMGGAAGGEQASKAVTEAIYEVANRNIERLYERPEALKEVLTMMVQESQQVITTITEKQPQLSGMGTTLTALLMVENRYAWCNIGDSRIYHYTGNALQQITEDHSYTRELIKKNEVPPDAAILDQYDHVITRVIDGSNQEPDVYPEKQDYLELQEGDQFILCSDGLIASKRQENAYLKQALEKAATVGAGAELLLHHALKAETKDNVTVIVARVAVEELNGVDKPVGKGVTFNKDSTKPKVPHLAQDSSKNSDAVKAGKSYKIPMIIFFILFIISAGVAILLWLAPAGLPFFSSR